MTGRFGKLSAEPMPHITITTEGKMPDNLQHIWKEREEFKLKIAKLRATLNEIGYCPDDEWPEFQKVARDKARKALVDEQLKDEI